MEKQKNIVSGAAYEHLRKFITEGLHLNPSELKAYRKALSNKQKIHAKNKKKSFCEFNKIKKKIYKELDIEQKELKAFKKLYINEQLTGKVKEQPIPKNSNIQEKNDDILNLLNHLL